MIHPEPFGFASFRVHGAVDKRQRLPPLTQLGPIIFDACTITLSSCAASYRHPASSHIAKLRTHLQRHSA
jgi:hypothetical protein